MQDDLTTILDTLKEYYFETDIRGVLTNINQPFSEHLGFKNKDEILGKHIRHFTSKDTFRKVFKNFSRVIETRETIDLFHYSYRTRDGRDRIGETTVSPIISGEDVVGARCVLRDITDRLAEEAELRRAKEAVEAQARELTAINRIGVIRNQSLNLNVILESLCEELTRIFPVRNAGIALMSTDKASLEVVAFHSVEADEKSALGIVLPLKDNQASREVLEKKKIIVVQDAQRDPRMKAVADVSRTRGTKSIMLIPLLSRGTAIGTIGMPARDPDYVFTEREINLAGIISGQIASAIDNAQLYARTETELGLVERDLEIGRQIQSGFFPETIPAIPGWEIAVHFEAARQVAGDFYDAFTFDNPRYTALVIADVCDKGVGAALYMVLFRSLLRAFSRIEIRPDAIQDQMVGIVSSTNNYIANIHGNANMFATLFFGVLDQETGILHYVNGGHEPPAILDRDGRLLSRLKPTGPAVGMFPDVPFTVGQYAFQQGEFLVGYTDGVSDAQNELGETFTEERLLKYVQVPWTSLFSMLFELKTELRNHMHGYKQFDDITLISVRRKDTPQVERHGICRPSSLACLPELEDFVETAAMHCRLEHKEAHAFKLAAEEICSNIIQYGYEGIAPGYLSIFLELDPGKVRLVIRDDGQHFPPERAAAPKLDDNWQDRQIGGLGVYFVHQLMDRVSYTRVEPGINQLVLEKDVQIEPIEPVRNASW